MIATLAVDFAAAAGVGRPRLATTVASNVKRTRTERKGFPQRGQNEGEDQPGRSIAPKMPPGNRNSGRHNPRQVRAGSRRAAAVSAGPDRSASAITSAQAA